MLAILFALQEGSAPREERVIAVQAAAEWAVHGRLLDALTGEPVPGATCELWSEDLEAPMELLAAAVSGPDGSISLESEPGRGDKLRVRAEGYRSTVCCGEDEVFLFPQDEPLVLRVLDLDGRPIAGASIRSHQTCQHAPAAVEGRSDADGRVALPDAPPFEDGAEYEVRAPGHGARTQIHWSTFGIDPVVYLPRRAEVRLRLLDAEGTPLANRRFRQQGPGHIALTTDSSGGAVLESLFESREIGLIESVESEPLTLHGWPALEGECTLQVGRQETFAGVPRADWPRLSVRAERGSALHVQYRNDSITREAGASQHEIPVAPGLTVTVLAQGQEVHRAVLEPWSLTRELDLTSPATLWPVAAARSEPVALRFAVACVGGRGGCESVSAVLRRPGPMLEDEDPSPEGVLFHVPRGERWEVRFSAEGCVPRWRQGRAGEEGSFTEPVVLQRRARVELQGPCERVELAGEVRTRADGEGWNVFEVAPGWVGGRAWFASGRELSIARQLLPGQQLVLDEFGDSGRNH